MTMPSMRFAIALVFAALCGAGATPAMSASASAADERMVDVGGHKLLVRDWPSAASKPVIVFEAGGGDDSSVWDTVVGPVRAATSARVIAYDRAGFGRSEPEAGAYAIDDEARAFERVLAAERVESCIVLVAHSYGGFLATLYANRHPDRVCGMVLVDANLAAFFDEAETAQVMAGYKADRDAVLSKSPALARVLDGFPATIARMRSISVPHGIPLIDIVAEYPAPPTEAEQAAWKRAHAAFVAADPRRTALEAKGSHHFVMHDDPQAVVDAVTKIYLDAAHAR